MACEASHEVVVIDVRMRRTRGDHCRRPSARGCHVQPRRLRGPTSATGWTTRFPSSTSPRARSSPRSPVGSEPHGVLTDRSGKTLYVLNMTADSISVIDTNSLKEVKRLAASRSPWAAALAPDGSRMYVTNNLSRLTKFREPPFSEVTVIDTETATVVDRNVVPQANLLGGHRLASQRRVRAVHAEPEQEPRAHDALASGVDDYQRPGHPLEGWPRGPGPAGRTGDRVFRTPRAWPSRPTAGWPWSPVPVPTAWPWSISRSSWPWSRAATDEEREHVLPNHLGKATEFVIAHIPTGQCPRGIVAAGDSRTAYVGQFA